MIKRACVGCVFPSFVKKKNFRSDTTFGTAIVKDRVNAFLLLLLYSATAIEMPEIWLNCNTCCENVFNYFKGYPVHMKTINYDLHDSIDLLIFSY